MAPSSQHCFNTVNGATNNGAVRVVIRAARIAGIQRDHCREIRTHHASMFALSSTELHGAMQADRWRGRRAGVLFLCATVGITQTTAVGPIGELCSVAAPHGVWVHVDAAYARSVLVSPEFHHVIDGVESMDSCSMNAHKWLLANDCCAMWVGKPFVLIAALGTEHEYILRDSRRRRRWWTTKTGRQRSPVASARSRLGSCSAAPLLRRRRRA
jgi:hypothetical protein